MYLVVFATLAIAILGTYTQVLAVEVARIAANQTSTASAMLAWHTAAVSMASSIVKTNSSTSTPAGLFSSANYPSGCSLSADKTGSNAFHVCPPPINISNSTATATQGSVTNSLSNASGTSFSANMIYNTTQSPNAPECVHLPNAQSNGTTCTTTFDVKHYEFYSVLFQDSTTGINYVVTFASAPTTGNASTTNYLTLASGTQISLTASDLLTQLKNKRLPSFSFGTFINGKVSGATYLTYPSGISNVIPSGAVAVISGGL